MVAFTPGVHFLITSVTPVLFGPPIVIHILLTIFCRFFSIQTITPGILACVYLFTPLVYMYVSSLLNDIKETSAARRLGARLPPHARGLIPGNIDLLFNGMTTTKTEYLGEPILGAWTLAGGVHTCALSILGDNRILTMSPRNIQKILATEFESYHKGVMFKGIMESMLGVGVFNSDGEMWQFHRKMTRPFFSKERVTDLLLYERKAATVLQRMQERFDAGLAVDYQDLVSRFTLDSAAEFLMGASVNSLDSPLPMPYNVSGAETQSSNASTASTRFAKAFSAAQIALLDRFELGKIWPVKEIFRDRIKDPMVEIKRFIDPIVRNAMTNRELGGSKDEETLLGHLIDVTDNMKVIVDETLNIMLAGRDTTASLLTFVTYCLAMYPEILCRLRQEILSIVGSVRAPTHDELREMKYLRAVLNETLRLYPPVPLNMRETIGETIWFDNDGGKLYIPPNTRIVFSVFHLQRCEDFWGPDAHIFDPDRWLDSRIRSYTSNPFIFVPFNAGPRICLGQQFAYHETSYFLVRFLQRFDRIELAPECQPPHTRVPESWKDPTTCISLNKRRALEQCYMRSHLTLYADGGLWIRAKQVQSETM